MAKTSEYCEEVGYVFVNENKGSEKQKVVIEVVSNMSSKMSVGFGNPDDFRDLCSFICDGILFYYPKDQWTKRLIPMSLPIPMGTKRD